MATKLDVNSSVTTPMEATTVSVIHPTNWLQMVTPVLVSHACSGEAW